MKAQRQNKQLSIPFVMPQLPKICGGNNGSNRLFCFNTADVCLSGMGKSGQPEPPILSSCPGQVLWRLLGPILCTPENFKAGSSPFISWNACLSFSSYSMPQEISGCISVSRESQGFTTYGNTPMSSVWHMGYFLLKVHLHKEGIPHIPHWDLSYTNPLARRHGMA